jgi:hypothetical protein
MTGLSAGPLLTRVVGPFALVLLLSALLNLAGARAASSNTTPNPAPQPAPHSSSPAPTPDPAPQAAPISSSSSSSNHQGPAEAPSTAQQQPQTGAAPSIAAPEVIAAPAISPSSAAGVATATPVLHVPANKPRRTRVTHHLARSVIAESAPAVTRWHWRDPLDVESVLSPSAPAAHRRGLPLLIAAIGLLLLVLVGGWTLRLLARMEPTLRTG